MSNNRDRRKALAKLIEAEFETIQVEIDNMPELLKCDYKSLKALNVESLINIRKNLQEISRNISKINRNMQEIQKRNFSTFETIKEPSEDMVFYCTKNVIDELKLFEK